MKLHELAQSSSVDELKQIEKNIEITGVSDLSSDVKEGFIFVAIEGFTTDGHQYIEQAIEKGAAVVVGQKEVKNCNVPYIQVKNSRKVVGQLAAAFYHFPCENKCVIGITGTNGKTTTSLFIRHLLKKAGHSVSYFGTVFNEVNGERTKSKMTTPNASVIQKALAESTDEFVVIEVSSQGLEQSRMEGMAFDYTLFTNLQHDHLDYHHTVEEYFLAKKRLFDLLKDTGKAIVFEDDQWGQKLVHLLKEEGKTVLSVGSSDTATIQLQDLTTYQTELRQADQTYTVSAPMPGKYNVINAVMAGTVLNDLGHSFEEMDDLFRDIEPISGRFERVKINERVEVVVDYAHTPEAIDVLLQTMRAVYPDSQLVHIFGFRGNRDTTKRGKMVETSLNQSDQIYLTTDDLNGVSEEDMKREYQSYQKENIHIVMDRTAAIHQALKQAIEKRETPSVIVITGKGHEKYKHPFQMHTTSDKETVEAFHSH